MRRGTAILLGSKRHRYHNLSAPMRQRLIWIGGVVFTLTYLSWAMANMSERTRVKQVLIDLSRIEHVTRLFRADNGRCPVDIEEMTSQRGTWQYVAPMVDPWGKPYQLLCPAPRDPGGVLVQSGGADGAVNGVGDISSL